MRLEACGETRAEYATPRMRFTMPSSVRLMGGRWRTTGSRTSTSPLPSGGAPRFTTCAAGVAEREQEA